MSAKVFKSNDNSSANNRFRCQNRGLAMNSRAPENPFAKQLDELLPCWLELSSWRGRIAFLPLFLLIEKHGGGVAYGSPAASALPRVPAAGQRSWR
jgi:hypothetical protein